mmetsp:Transcript_39573/g.60482  ORF Transcript_39573/g.60482 Transcript_39573/m.60482 type:complete len:127 (+) Transcript_39573:2445-2825(+)
MLDRQRKLQEKQQQRKEEAAAESKTVKSKEELAQLRKDMMKKRPAQHASTLPEKKVEEKPHPKAALMERLATGSRAGVSQKAMKELTVKNYNNLPEVRRKREEEKKKEEARARIEQVRKMGQASRS